MSRADKAAERKLLAVAIRAVSSALDAAIWKKLPGGASMDYPALQLLTNENRADVRRAATLLSQVATRMEQGVF